MDLFINQNFSPSTMCTIIIYFKRKIVKKQKYLMPSETVPKKNHCIIASFLVCLAFYFDFFRPSTQNSLFHFNIVLTKISLKILLSIIYNARFTLAIIMMVKFTKSQTHSEHAIHFGNIFQLDFHWCIFHVIWFHSQFIRKICNKKFT